MTAAVTFDLVSSLPIANDDAYTVTDMTLNIAVPQGLLCNDTDGIGSLSVVSIQAPSHGILNISTDGSFIYTPDSEQDTNETLIYTMTDTLGRTDSAEVTFDLESTLPVANDDFFQVIQGQLLSVAALGVLANDIAVIGDPQLLSVVSPADGIGQFFNDGSFTFLPNAGFTGITSFDYTMVDGLFRTSSATVTIEVLPLVTTVPEPATSVVLILTTAILGRRTRKC